MELVEIREQNIEIYWPDILPLLEGAAERSNGRFDVPSTLRKVAAGEWQLWAGVENEQLYAIAVTSIEKFPTGMLACNIVIVTGVDRKKWLHLIDDIYAWGVSRGCSLGMMWARKGYVKAKELSDHKMTHVMLERRLE